jgi:hypothetical protein
VVLVSICTLKARDGLEGLTSHTKTGPCRSKQAFAFGDFSLGCSYQHYRYCVFGKDTPEGQASNLRSRSSQTADTSRRGVHGGLPRIAYRRRQLWLSLQQKVSRNIICSSAMH